MERCISKYDHLLMDVIKAADVKFKLFNMSLDIKQITEFQRDKSKWLCFLGNDVFELYFSDDINPYSPPLLSEIIDYLLWGYENIDDGVAKWCESHGVCLHDEVGYEDERIYMKTVETINKLRKSLGDERVVELKRLVDEATTNKT